jgi:hypothetical protein
MTYQVSRHFFDAGVVEGSFERCKASAADIQGNHSQGIIHGYRSMRHPDYATPVSESLVKGFAQADGNIFNHVMLVSPRS